MSSRPAALIVVPVASFMATDTVSTLLIGKLVKAWSGVPAPPSSATLILMVSAPAPPSIVSLTVKPPAMSIVSSPDPPVTVALPPAATPIVRSPVAAEPSMVVTVFASAEIVRSLLPAMFRVFSARYLLLTVSVDATSSVVTVRVSIPSANAPPVMFETVRFWLSAVPDTVAAV